MHQETGGVDIQGNTPFLVMKTARLLKYRLDKALQVYGVTAAQFSVMNLICSQNDDITSAEIAACLSTDRPTISAIIRRLEEKGLLLRRVHPDDRRSEILRLTNDALELQKKVRQETDSMTATLEGLLNRSELDTFRHVLRILLDHLEREET